jgi:hypothetical protein
MLDPILPAMERPFFFFYKPDDFDMGPQAVFLPQVSRLLLASAYAAALDARGGK